jgi:mRNA-degrading endonuclease toxin of MazEF toxin-antitoxin module
VSPSRPLQLGSVLWAELEDSNGYRKVRPVVVVSPTADIKAGKPMRVVAITTRLPEPLPDDHVLLPWDRQGKARSGLRRRCAAVASWQAEVPVHAAQQVVGILPPEAIRELLAKLASVLPTPLATTAPTPPPGDPATLPSSVTPGAPPPDAGDPQDPESTGQGA